MFSLNMYETCHSILQPADDKYSSAASASVQQLLPWTLGPLHTSASSNIFSSPLGGAVTINFLLLVWAPWISRLNIPACAISLRVCRSSAPYSISLITVPQIVAFSSVFTRSVWCRYRQCVIRGRLFIMVPYGKSQNNCPKLSLALPYCHNCKSAASLDRQIMSNVIVITDLVFPWASQGGTLHTLNHFGAGASQVLCKFTIAESDIDGTHVFTFCPIGKLASLILVHRFK